MNSEFEKIEALVPDFQYVDSDHDRLVLTVGFTASFYFWNGHQAATREALVRCFEAFEAAFGAHLAWRFDADDGRFVRVDEKKAISLREHVGTLDEDDCIEWYITSGDDHDAVADYVSSAVTERGWMEGRCSSFRIQVPRFVPFESETATTLFDLILFCQKQLSPFHGNAGLNAVRPYEELTWEAELLDEATRYQTLYIDSSVIDKMKAPLGIKGVNWLTFIGNTLSERLGGPAPFVAYCRRFGVEPIPVGEGFMIRAGEFPQLGPVGAPIPSDYMRANAALRPLRNGNSGSMGTGSISGELRFDRCTSDLWVRRLDAPDTWPPKSFIGLPRVPLGATPRKRLTLQTGDACAVHGRYRQAGFVTPPEFAEDIAPMVVLLPGDIAPFLLKLGPHGEFLGRAAVKWELIAEL